MGGSRNQSITLPLPKCTKIKMWIKSLVGQPVEVWPPPFRAVNVCLTLLWFDLSKPFKICLLAKWLSICLNLLKHSIIFCNCTTTPFNTLWKDLKGRKIGLWYCSENQWREKPILCWTTEGAQHVQSLPQRSITSWTHADWTAVSAWIHAQRALIGQWPRWVTHDARSGSKQCTDTGIRVYGCACDRKGVSAGFATEVEGR